jgi:hypothetical protein
MERDHSYWIGAFPQRATGQAVRALSHHAGPGDVDDMQMERVGKF